MSTRIVVFVALAIATCGLAATGEPKGKSVANYHAVQNGKKVTIFAEGTNNSGGWKNALVQLPQEIFPPEFKFTQTRPNGPAIQVISKFSVQASFDAGAPVEHVFVTDAGGRHKVVVAK